LSLRMAQGKEQGVRGGVAMTWLGLLNSVILQWFFVRLAKIVDTETKVIVGWDLLRWIVPLTGWWSDYRYVGRRDRN